MRNSIVIDTNIMRHYAAPLDPVYLELFQWLIRKGQLIVSQKLISEYVGTGNRELVIFVESLSRHSAKEGEKIECLPIRKISKKVIESFARQDRHYKYTCNIEDIHHARLVFVSPRKKMICGDNKLMKDINRFPKVGGIKPRSERRPDPSFYE